MKITYNSPFILTYTLICVVITSLDTLAFGGVEGQQVGPISKIFFMVYPFGWPEMAFNNPLTYLRLFSHALGHAGWGHLVGNFTFILLLGPILEEKYGTKKLILLVFLTALITGVLNATFFRNPLLGASGVVFMMILLVSFTNVQKRTIPLTFILISLLFLGKEIYNAVFVHNQVSEFAHIIGGLCGGVFGYMLNSGSTQEKSAKQTKTASSTNPLKTDDFDISNFDNL